MRRDLFWINAVLGAAILLFLNIFVQGKFHRFQSNKHSYFSAELSKENKTFNPARLTADSTGEKADSSLSLELLGTIIGKTSLAFIHNLDTDKQGVYRLNDFIDGYVIAGILPGKVILEKNGNSQELLLAIHSVKFQDKESIFSTGLDGSIVISKYQMVSQIPKVNEILTKLKILPMPDSASNKLKGFRIDNVPLGSIIEKAGIKNGDIIYAVEDKKLQSVQDAWQMFDAIQNRSRFEVVLLRDGKPVRLRYEIRN